MSKRLDETVLECGDELKSLKMSGEEGERHKHVVHSRKSGLLLPDAQHRQRRH